jgi:hypothetical protein
VQKEYLKIKDNFGCFPQQEISFLLAPIHKLFMYIIMLLYAFYIAIVNLLEPGYVIQHSDLTLGWTTML